MRNGLVFALMTFCLVTAACVTDRNPVIPLTESGFALYLLADTTLTANGLSGIPIDSLILAEKPALTIASLNWYRWSDHRLSVKSEVAAGLRPRLRRPTVFGIPFVITAHGSRRYLGAFWYAFSSIAPAVPNISGDAFLMSDPPPTEWTVERAWMGAIDARNDDLVHDALKQAHKLIE
jgi:hypothetical protein